MTHKDIEIQKEIDNLNKLASIVEVMLTDSDYLKNMLASKSNELNFFLRHSITRFKKIMQRFVDEFYERKFTVDSFMQMTLKNFSVSKEHNLTLVKNMKKLLYYAQKDWHI